MVKKIIVRGLFMVFFFCFFLIYLAPANKLLSIVDLPKNIKLYGVNGDLWEGCIDTIDVDQFRINNVKWELDFFTLVFARGLSVSIDDDNVAKGVFGLNVFDLDKELYLSGIDIRTTLENVLTYVKLPMPVKASGIIHTDLNHVAIIKNGTIKAINGTVVARDVVVKNPLDPETDIDLGRVTFDIQTPKGKVPKLEISIDQDSTMFKVNNLKVTISNMSEIEVEGAIKPKGSIPESLATMLNMLGKPDASGAIKISYKTKI